MVQLFLIHLPMSFKLYGISSFFTCIVRFFEKPVFVCKLLIISSICAWTNHTPSMAVSTLWFEILYNNPENTRQHFTISRILSNQSYDSMGKPLDIQFLVIRVGCPPPPATTGISFWGRSLGRSRSHRRSSTMWRLYLDHTVNCLQPICRQEQVWPRHPQ